MLLKCGFGFQDVACIGDAPDSGVLVLISRGAAYADGANNLPRSILNQDTARTRHHLAPRAVDHAQHLAVPANVALARVLVTEGSTGGLHGQAAPGFVVGEVGDSAVRAAVHAHHDEGVAARVEDVDGNWVELVPFDAVDDGVGDVRGLREGQVIRLSFSGTDRFLI